MIQDPREEKIIEKLVEIIGGAAVAFVSTLDAIAEESTCKACADVVKTLGGGKVVTNRAEGLTVKLEGVELLPVYDTAGIVHNKEVAEGIWRHCVPEALNTRDLRALPKPVPVGKGLETIPEALESCKKRLSAGKIVVEI